MTIDWTKPLELMDGTPVRLAASGFNDGPNPDKDGDYWIEWNDRRECCAADGGHVSGVQNGMVRNRQPEQWQIYTPTETLRDRFAMAALTTCDRGGNPDEIADWCYEVANAMLAARGEG